MDIWAALLRAIFRVLLARTSVQGIIITYLWEELQHSPHEGVRFIALRAEQSDACHRLVSSRSSRQNMVVCNTQKCCSKYSIFNVINIMIGTCAYCASSI